MKKLLVVVDYQYDFVNGSLGFPGAACLEEPIAEKIAKYRLDNNEVCFTFDTHDENYLSTQEGKNLPFAHCVKGTKGFELFGKIAELIGEEDKRFYKPTFGSSDLYEYIKTKNYEAIELVGLVSNICVLSNAILAKTALPEAKVIVDASCTGCMDKGLNKAALDVMEGLQIEIINK